MSESVKSEIITTMLLWF